MTTYHFPPGPKPVAGNALEMGQGQLAFITRLQREYGKVSTFYLPQRSSLATLSCPGQW